MLLRKACVQHTRPIYGAAERCSIKQALWCCPVQTTRAHTVTLCCPLNVPVTTATVTVFSCCLDNARVLHRLICRDKDADTSERRKVTLCFGKEVALACIDWPSDLSLFTRAQQNRDLIDPVLNCKSSFIFYLANYTHLYTYQMTGLDLFSTLLLFLQGHACPAHVVLCDTCIHCHCSLSES